MAAVTATVTFVTYVDGVRTRVAEGAVYDSTDPVVKEHEELFAAPETVIRSKTPAASRPTVESATAAPGEKRTTKRD